MRPNTFAMLSAVALAAASAPASPARAQGAALSGTVHSTEEGPMEGVLVSARRDGSTMMVTVVSDATGGFRFPAAKLTAGHYAISIRAAGYDLDGAPAVELSAGQPGQVDVPLRRTADLAAQMTNSEWMASLPGDPEHKQFMQNCTNCHTLQFPLGSTHTAAEFVDVQKRMAGYAQSSSPLMPQRLLQERITDAGEFQLDRTQALIRDHAEYLSAVNLNGRETWPFALKTFPRPTGRATHVVITTYDLPQPTRMPHDVIVGQDGTVWYNSFAEQILGKLDPVTGKVTEYTVPTSKPNAPKGSLAVRPDPDGNIWLGLSYQAGVARFDPKAETFKVWSLPPELNRDYSQTTEVDPTRSNVDGKVWIEDSGTYSIYRLDIATGKFEVFQPIPIPSPNIYDIGADAQNGVFFTLFGRSDIGHIDAKTGKIVMWPLPAAAAAPRRGAVDDQGRFWFGEFRGNKIGMFDPKTERFAEWTPPTPFYYPYDVVADKNGEVWAGSMQADRVERLNPATGQFVEYLMPRETNMRRVFVQETTNPVTFWVGSNHGAAIEKVEPLD